MQFFNWMIFIFEIFSKKLQPSLAFSAGKSPKSFSEMSEIAPKPLGSLEGEPGTLEYTLLNESRPLHDFA